MTNILLIMGLISKLFAAGLGFVVAGPIGALVGLFLSSSFTNITQSDNDYSRKRTNNTAEGDFKVSLLVLIACVMKADGTVKKNELPVDTL